MDLALNNLQRLIRHKTQTINYLSKCCEKPSAKTGVKNSQRSKIIIKKILLETKK